MQNNRLKKKVMIIAGGSGGHVFPGLSVACYLMESGYNVIWLGGVNNIESELVPQYGIDIKLIWIQGLRGKKLYTKFIVLFFSFFIAIYQSLKIIKYWKPDIVVGWGGYVSGPGGLAAWLSGIPLIIHEQNKVIGLTNRLLSFFAKIVLQGLPNVVARGSIIVGNPIRSAILSIPEPIGRWKNRVGPIRVLVVGGSQGAHIFNIVVPKIVEKLADKLIIWHQTGKKDFHSVVQAYKKMKKNIYKIEAFIYNIEQAYTWADLVISRSGALTVSEVAYVGLPAIFVPFCFHKDRQQYWNAMLLEQIGAAQIIEQEQFTVDYVSLILKSLDRTVLLNMASRAKTLAVSNSTELIAKIITQNLQR